jgi:hypothetical protein
MIGTPEVLKLSEKTTVEVAVLDGDEVDSADVIVSGRSGGLDKDGNFPVLAYSVLSSKIYAVCSIRKINGEAVMPLQSELQYRATAKRFTIAEIRELTKWAKPHYSVTEDEAKNEQPAPESSE